MKLRLLLLLVCGMMLLSPAVSRSAVAVPTPAAATTPVPPATRLKHHGFAHWLKATFPMPFGEGRQEVRSDSNGWAIASLVCGIIGLFVAGIPLGIGAVVFGVLGLNPNRRNRGLAIAGIILGFVDVIGALIVISMMR